MSAKTTICDNSSHHLHNPLKDVITPTNKLKHVAKATVKARQDALKEKDAVLQEDYINFFEKQDEDLEDIANKHGKKPKYIKCILTSTSIFKPQHTPSLQNALVHFKGKELNEGHAPGECLTLWEIQEVDKDENLKNLLKEHQKELIQDLVDHRTVKHTGAHSSNRAATLDYQNTVGCIQKEIENLVERTGCIGFAFFSQGHLNDSMVPAWFGSDEALDFMVDILGIPAAEVSVKFELWAITRKKHNKGNSLPEIQKECTKLITNGLKNILNQGDVQMQYVCYDRDIQSHYNVELHGWPHSITFMLPHNITTMFDICLLYNSLLSGDCHWATMTCQDIDSLVERLQNVPKKPQACQSDLGTTRGPCQGKASSADKTSAKRKKGKENKRAGKKKASGTVPTISQVPPMYKSKEFIESSDDEMEED